MTNDTTFSMIDELTMISAKIELETAELARLKERKRFLEQQNETAQNSILYALVMDDGKVISEVDNILCRC